MARIELVDRFDRNMFPGYLIAEVNGSKAQNITGFLKEVSKAFKFPSYFGFNYNALKECLNDLDWIDQDNYLLLIENYDQLLLEEDAIDLSDTLKLLIKTANEWVNVPNFKGEEEFIKRANFKIFIAKTEKAVNDLKAIQ